MSRLTGMLRLVHSSASERQRQSLDDEALQWVIRLTSGETNEDDHQAFRAWRDQSDEHRQALARARTLWTQMGAELPNLVRNRRSRLRRAAPKLAIAASLLLCVGLTREFVTDWQYDYATDAGEQQVVQLPDGSEMILAGDSAVDLRFEDGVREIRLARGQALFTAVHDDSRPFMVVAGDHNVRDIGTVFSVERSGDETRVVVAEGAVEAAVGNVRTVLTTDQQIALGAPEPPEVKKVNAAGATAWSRGQLIVEDETLENILDKLEPHFSGSIFLLNDSARQQRLTAVVDLGEVENWLAGLERTKLVSVTRVGNVYFLS